MLRFLPWVNGGAWSADKLALDAVHAVVWWLGSQAVEASQHTNARRCDSVHCHCHWRPC